VAQIRRAEHEHTAASQYPVHFSAEVFRMLDMLGRLTRVLERRTERGVTSLLMVPRPRANLEEL